MRRVLISLCAALGVLLAGLSACADGALLLTRDFSSRYAAAGGGWITVSYTLRNVSRKAIGKIELSDPLLGGDQPEPVDGLAPGESRTIVVRALVTEDTESAPVARYARNGGQETASAPPETVFVETVALFTALTPAEDGSEALTLTVTNLGSAPVYGVKAEDGALGDMGPSASRLDPGESAAWTRPAGPGRYQCAVSATGSSGELISLHSNELTIEAAPPAEAAPVSLSASLDGGQILLTLSNPGATLRSVTLRERNGRGERTLAFVPAGGSACTVWPLVPGESTLFAFEAVSMEGGVLAETSFAVPEAAIPDGTGEAADDLLAALDGPSLRMNDPSRTYRAMIAAAAVALAATLIVWHLFHRRRRRQARRARLRRRPGKKKQQIKRNGEKPA